MDFSPQKTHLIAQNIAVPHGFTTRLGGVSSGIHDSLNLGCHRGDSMENVAQNYAILSRQLGFSPENLVRTRQVHGDTVRLVTKADARGLDHRLYPECDGLITNDPGTALVVFTADCTPILLWDPVTGAVGAVHAGWRGTALAIAGKAVDAMAASFDCKAENIRAAIGPNIGKCCFETREDVPTALKEALGTLIDPFVEPRNHRFFVDLKGINAAILRSRGVENIEISTHCTLCSHDLFWSHRYTKGERGSQGALILCKEKSV